MKLSLFLFILLSINSEGLNREYKCYKGQYDGFLHSEIVFMVKGIDSTRIIALVYNKIGPLITYDSSFSNTKTNTENVELSDTNGKYFILIKLEDLVYEDLGYGKKYEKKFELNLCKIEDIIPIINYAYLYKTKRSDFKRIDSFDDAPERRGIYNQGYSVLYDLTKVIDEVDFKTKVDSFSNSFWSKYNH